MIVRNNMPSIRYLDGNTKSSKIQRGKHNFFQSLLALVGACAEFHSQDPFSKDSLLAGLNPKSDLI